MQRALSFSFLPRLLLVVGSPFLNRLEEETSASNLRAFHIFASSLAASFEAAQMLHTERIPRKNGRPAVIRS